jgi:Uncharacterized conserved protein
MPLASYSRFNVMERPSHPRKTKPLQTGFPEIDALDFSSIRFLLKHKAGDDHSERELDLREDHFRAFLALHKHSPHLAFAPSRFTDAFWHEAYADTAWYAKMCDDVFGELLEHFPYVGIRSEADSEVLDAAFERTHEHLAMHFPKLVKHKVPATCLCSSGRSPRLTCELDDGSTCI